MNAHQRRVAKRRAYHRTERNLAQVGFKLYPHQLEAIKRLKNLNHVSDVTVPGRSVTSLRQRIPSLQSIPKPVIIMAASDFQPMPLGQAEDRLRRAAKVSPEVWLFEGERDATQFQTMRVLKERNQADGKFHFAPTLSIIDEVGEDFKPEGEKDGN